MELSACEVGLRQPQNIFVKIVKSHCESLLELSELFLEPVVALLP